MVKSLLDSGIDTLRQAMLDAVPGDTINFDGSVFPSSTPMTITLIGALPTMTVGNVTIDASDAGVVLDGANTPDGTIGLLIQSNSNVVKGLTIVNFPGDGVRIENSSLNTIGGRYTIGTAPHGEGNIITRGGDNGVHITGGTAMSNTIIGNLIGVDVDGTEDFRITALAVSPTYQNDQTILMGTRFHGVWRSQNGGASWTPFNAGLTNLAIFAIAFSPSYASDKTIFVGASAGGLYKSTNGGPTWVKVGSGVIDRNVTTIVPAPNFAVEGHIFVGTKGGNMFVSTDKGDTWVQRRDGITDWQIQHVAVSPNYASDHSVFVLTWDKLFQSTNQGQSWSQVGGAIAKGMTQIALSPNFSSDRTMYIGTTLCDSTSSKIWRSIDAGLHWQAIGGTQDWCGLKQLVISPGFAIDKTLIASDDWKGVFKSTDGGVTWINILPTGRQNYAMVLSPDFVQDQTIFVGNPIGILRKSIDAGGIWQNLPTAFSEPGNRYFGVYILAGAHNNQVGGFSLGQRNVISRNGINGIGVSNLGTEHNLILGNYIGTDATGAHPLGNVAEGIVMSDKAAFNEIRGNVLSGNMRMGVGLWDSGTVSNTIVGNMIGTDGSGMFSVPNESANIIVSAGAQFNVIGGLSSGDRNIISGGADQGVGIFDHGTNLNSVLGNYIGLKSNGIEKLANVYNGVVINNGAQQNRIANNVISGNDDNGISISGDGTDYNIVSGNRVGTDSTGTKRIGNREHGVRLEAGASHNIIGGVLTHESNLISGNFNGVGMGDANTISNTIVNN